MHVTEAAGTDYDLFAVQSKLLTSILAHKEDTLWKVLIFDTFNQQTLKTLFKVIDLRQHNITLYMNITERRQQLHGVTAFYLVQPNTENIERIIEDFNDDLYSAVSIHFSAEPSNHILSTLAKTIAGRYPKQLNKIRRVSHSFCGYHVVDRTMALLANEIEMASFLAQFKHPPLLIYQKSEQEFAVKLKDRLETLKTTTLFNDTTAYTGVLIINRESDYAPVFFHEVTYGALMGDVYDMLSYNKVQLGKEVREFDVKDEVWIDRKHMLSSEFDLERQITRLKTKQANLKENMDQAAQLNEQNLKLDWHLMRVKDLITQATERQLNRFFQVGFDLLTTKKLSKDNKKTVLQLLQSPDNIDKLRLVLLYIICCDDLSSLQQFQKMMEGVPKPPLYTQLRDRRLKQIAAQKEGSTKYIKHLAKGLLKNLITNEKKFVVTRLAEQMGRSSLPESEFETLELRRTEGRLGKLVVYVRGGTCINEYENLREYLPQAIYCGDRLVHAKDLLK